MRNRFAGPCYRCGLAVPAGAGYFEKRKDGPGFRVQHCYTSHNNGITCEMAKTGRTKPTKRERLEHAGLPT